MSLSNKYSDEEIMQMCQDVLQAKHDASPLYPQFLMVMSMITNLDPHEIEDKIKNCLVKGSWD